MNICTYGAFSSCVNNVNCHLQINIYYIYIYTYTYVSVYNNDNIDVFSNANGVYTYINVCRTYIY